MHGWFIQVIEAPTPVSALLHARVVNLGGLLLIRRGTLVADLPAAQALLFMVGSFTAVVAALVMMTRISIKVSPCCSTCPTALTVEQTGLPPKQLARLRPRLPILGGPNTEARVNIAAAALGGMGLGDRAK